MTAAAGATPMQQLQLQQAQIQREQARINDFWNDVGREMGQIDPEKVLTLQIKLNLLLLLTAITPAACCCLLLPSLPVLLDRSALLICSSSIYVNPKMWANAVL